MKHWNWFLLIMTALLACHVYSRADEGYGVYLDEFSVDYGVFRQGSREPVLYPYTPKERLDVNANLSFLRYGYLHNTIHSETDPNQFRLIGWHYQLGVHVGPWADIYAEHFSQHLLDVAGDMPYPSENIFGIKFYLYRRK